MGLMDIKINHAPIGNASVEIDLGQGHTLIVRAQHQTDRFREVTVIWDLPSQPLGPVEAIRDRKRDPLVKTALDLQERKTTTIQEARRIR